MLAARATLRSTEQSVLLDAVTAYMNLLRDTAILGLQKSNVDVLQEQLRQTRDRFNVGEVTRTDVAQSEASLASGQSQYLTAESNYKSSAATYRKVIGVTPGKLAAGTPVDRFSPSNLERGDRGCQFEPPVGRRRAVQYRRRAGRREGAGSRALSDGVGDGLLHQELSCRPAA